MIRTQTDDTSYRHETNFYQRKANSTQFTGQITGTNCCSNKHADVDCGTKDTDTRLVSCLSNGNIMLLCDRAYGFNNADGGVFAFLQDNSNGISLFSR